jgi:hypothetical protein
MFIRSGDANIHYALGDRGIIPVVDTQELSLEVETPVEGYSSSSSKR